MPVIEIEATEKSGCSVVCFAPDGLEKSEADESFLSKTLVDGVSSGELQIDDIFVLIHGWQGDAVGATTNYREWIKTMQSCRRDHRGNYGLPTTYKAGVVGIHWPSRPIGDELFPPTTRKPFEAMDMSDRLDIEISDVVSICAKSIVDTELARAAYKQLFDSSNQNGSALESVDSLKSELVDIVSKIVAESDRVAQTLGATSRAAGLDAISKATAVVENASKMLGRPSRAGLAASIANALSFYEMKTRADLVGKKGCSQFLQQLLDMVPERIGIHLMGHSFGCIVASSMVAYANSSRRKVDSLSLVQGALPLWSFSDAMPGLPTGGLYRKALENVSGPIFCTTSQSDTAVKNSYPAAVSALDQDRYELGSIFPNYGGLGTFGARGHGILSMDIALKPVEHNYVLESGILYNVEADAYICNGGWPSGSHCDIAKPELANLIWQGATMHRQKRTPDASKG